MTDRDLKRDSDLIFKHLYDRASIEAFTRILNEFRYHRESPQSSVRYVSSATLMRVDGPNEDDQP